MMMDDVDLYVALVDKFKWVRENAMGYELDKFLEAEAPHNFKSYFNLRATREGMFLTDEKRALAQSFLGTHGDTLLKAYKIRRGLE